MKAVTTRQARVPDAQKKRVKRFNTDDTEIKRKAPRMARATAKTQSSRRRLAGL
jgi:hypothetical protein